MLLSSLLFQLLLLSIPPLPLPLPLPPILCIFCVFDDNGLTDVELSESVNKEEEAGFLDTVCTFIVEASAVINEKLSAGILNMLDYVI